MKKMFFYFLVFGGIFMTLVYFVYNRTCLGGFSTPFQSTAIDSDSVNFEHYIPYKNGFIAFAHTRDTLEIIMAKMTKEKQLVKAYKILGNNEMPLLQMEPGEYRSYRTGGSLKFFNASWNEAGYIRFNFFYQPTCICTLVF